MKLRATLFLLAICALPAQSQPKTDITQPQSPTLPAPKWLQIEDKGKHDPRLKGYFAPAGIKVEVVAEEPAVVNPVGMTFGTDGTLYVLEWRPSPGDEWKETPEEFTYKDGSKRKVATMKKKSKDVCKILRLNPKTNTYDKSEIILEEELPSTLLLHDGWLYTASRGSVRRYRLSHLDSRADRSKPPQMEVIAQGFCGFHHHQVSGLTIGNDGWLYITSGDDDNFAEGSDGSRATVLRTGAVFRCRPDGSNLQVYSIGYRNPYRDLAFDTTYNWFHVDNDNEDGSKFTGCRLMHVAEEVDFGWRLFTGARCCRPDHVRGAVFGEMPGKMPAMLKTGRGSPAGLLIYNDVFFPEQYRGLLYYPDCFRKLIRAYRVQPAGATFQAVEEFEFLKSEDPLFRPCQMIVGPDGAMYVCDWRTDSGGAGRLWGDGTHGRIYRLSWAGTDDEPAIRLRGLNSWHSIVRDSDDELLKKLSAENFSDRLMVQAELRRRGERNRATLLGLLGDPSRPRPVRLAALGVVQSFWNSDVRDLFFKLLTDSDPDIARLAADGIALNCQPGDAQAANEIIKALFDDRPPVRRALALALGRIGGPGAEDALLNLFRFEKRNDRYLVDGIVRGIERTGSRGMRKLIDLAMSGSDQDRDRVVEAFLTLRTRSGAEALPELLTIAHLTSDQRANLIKSFANYLLDPPLNLEVLLDPRVIRTDAPAIEQRAVLHILGLFGAVQGERVEKWLIGLLAHADPDLRLTAIHTVEQVKLQRAVPTLISRLGDETWTAPERLALLKALRVFNDKSSIQPLKSILAKGKPATPDSQTLYVEALRSLITLDPDSASSFAFTMLAYDDVTLQAEAIATLALKPDGAKQVAEMMLAKKLPRELIPLVSDGLRRHVAKNPDLNKLLTEVMRGALLVSLDQEQIAKVQDLVKTRGNPQRGRALFLDSKVLACVNCHKLEGIGGAVGPDLTRVWETHSLEKIMESMIEPSKEIKEGYQSYVATTKKGLTYTGLKVVDTPTEIVLKDAQAKEIRIAKKDLDDLEPSKVSLMPDNVISQLSFEQFIDLVAFLKDRSAQESLRSMALEFWVAGTFPREFREVQPPEQNADPKAVYHNAAGEKIAWQLKPTEPNGYLDLQSIFKKERVAVYALTYVYSPKKQKVRLLTGSDDALRVWIGGKLVHEVERNRTAVADEDQVEVELNEGWSPVLAKVINLVATHGLFLRFSGGEGIRVAATPDLKK